MGSKTVDEMRPLLFVDGAGLSGGDARLLLGCAFAPPADGGRVLLSFRDSQWSHFDLPDEIVSVAADDDRQTLIVLTKSGFVARASLDNVHIDRLPDSGTGSGRFGYVSQVKVIDHRLFVCGDLHQVYESTTAGWHHMDAEILVHDKLSVGRCLNSIDGISSSAIFSVGDRGVVNFFDGSAWTTLDSPTNVSLERVLCKANDDVIIVGDMGTVLAGGRRGVHVVAEDDRVGRLWGLAEFRGKIFTCSTTSLFVVQDGELQPVLIPLAFEGSLHRLSAIADLLWVIGTNVVLAYDGACWEEVRYPGNRA